MAVNKGNFSVGGTQFKAKSIKQTNESLATEDSGRSDDGVMHISWIKTKLRKWEIELPPTDSATVSSLFSKVQGKIYNITIFDVTTNSVQTVNVYTSNTESDCYSGVLLNGLYQGVSFSAIEVG